MRSVHQMELSQLQSVLRLVLVRWSPFVEVMRRTARQVRLLEMDSQASITKKNKRSDLSANYSHSVARLKHTCMHCNVSARGGLHNELSPAPKSPLTTGDRISVRWLSASSQASLLSVDEENHRFGYGKSRFDFRKNRDFKSRQWQMCLIYHAVSLNSQLNRHRPAVCH